MIEAELPAKKQSDLKTRSLSAIFMIAIAGAALWIGGVVFTLFSGAIAAGVIWEFWGLVRRISTNIWVLLVSMLIGIFYVGTAAWSLVQIRTNEDGDPYLIVTIISAVIAVDVGAYFAGRIIGGPKIAPKISPSKTWAGLFGGIIGAMIIIGIYMAYAFGLDEDLADNPMATTFWIYVPISALITASVAQAGDFFESWLKRKAGVKDSGSLIPGHGGLFDRVDGLLAVSFAFYLISWLQ